MEQNKKLLISNKNGFSTDIKGLVSMLTEQFREPSLCFRELVQNSLDENASKIKLDFNYDHEKFLSIISFTDNGIGMDYEKLKRYLTIFDSTKENLRDKIGEFGIGKLSVFAIKPESLVIETGNGKDAYKVVINKDLSGNIMKIKPRKGTRVTIIKDGSCNRDNIISYLEESCEYSPIPIIIDSKKIIGKRLDSNAKYKMPFKFKTESGYEAKGINSIVNNDVSRFLALKGGLKLGEVDFPFEGESAYWRIPCLETIIDSFAFNHPMSRNKVKRDDNFDEIIKNMVKGPLTEFSKFCSSELRRIESEKNKDIIKNFLESENIEKFLLGYMAILSEKDSTWNIIPKELLEINLFRTIDNENISFNDLKESYKKNKFIYVSRYYNPNCLKYFKEKRIPVITEGKNSYPCFTILKSRLGHLISIDENITLLEYKEKAKSKKEENYLSILSGLFHPFHSLRRLNKNNNKINDNKKNEKDYNAEFFDEKIDLEEINSAELVYFRAINGRPARWKTIDIRDNKLFLNLFSNYIQSMINLSSKDPYLAKFYTLCEIVRNREVLPNINPVDAEDFIIGQLESYLKTK